MTLADVDDELPNSWQWASLEELIGDDAPIIYGIIQPGPDVPGGVPYVRPTEIVDGRIDVSALRRTSADIAKRYGRATLRTGDILLSIVGTIGKVAVVPPELEGANITQCSARLRPPTALGDGKFIVAALKAPILRAQYDKVGFGVAVQRLNIAHVRDLRMPVPPLPEQRRIVTKLDALTAKSRRAKEALDAIPPLLDKFRQSVLAAAFRGDLTSEWRAKNPDVEPAEKLLQRIRAERRRRWEEAELTKLRAKGKAPGDDRWKEKYEPWCPRGARDEGGVRRADEAGVGDLPPSWLAVRLGDVVQLQPGYAFKSEWFSDNGTRLLRGTNIVPDGTRWEDVAHIPNEDAKEFADYALSVGDIVIAMDRPFISTGLKVVQLTETDLPALLLQRVGRFQLASNINPGFMYQFLRSHQFISHLIDRATGTQLPHVSAGDIESVLLPLPPLAEQAQIVEAARRAMQTELFLRSAVADTQASLGVMDRAILAKAFRGDLVPQDPADEPASVLLDRIRRERAEGTADGARKPRKSRKTSPDP